ncbi:MAG: methanol dehydrogenase [Rhodospirillales bacterium]|nr:methanol dehydrogenase [Rhodospirillales bacterium]
MIRRLLIAAALLVVATPLFIAILPAIAADIAFPALTGRVVDQAGILPPQDVAKLTIQLAAHEQRTGQQVVVAVVKSLEGQPIEDYGVELGRFWGIGQKGKNTGAILLVSPADRKVRIEVGYGLEGELTDAVSSTIIDQVMLPHFRQGDMAGGIVAGTGQILRALGDDVPVTVPPPTRRQQEGNGHGSIGSILFTFLIFGLFIWLARRRGGGIGSAILPFIIANSWSSRGGGSSWDSSNGGGGGFSGGGGSFGGGGASGSW